MGSVPPELSLDLRPTFVPKTIADFLKEVSTIGNAHDKLSRLDDFLKRLEEEMRKIDAFKRELPLCMLLLNDAISILKEESSQCRVLNAKPVLEEFIPLKKESDKIEETNKGKDCRDNKMNWMSSVQLWNTDNCSTNNDQKHHSKVDNKKHEEESRSAAEDMFPSLRNRNGGRAFLPFKAYAGVPVTPMANKEVKESLPVHGLSLLTPGIKNLSQAPGTIGSRSICSRGVSSSTSSLQSNLRTVSQPQHPTARKQRRCWSPELHRRFVNALQQLGGSQVATPKQIRELMQVDGLTNDEVKSHLQKYRLHTRRLPTPAPAPGNQSVVVLGGLWVSQDQYGDSSKGSSSQSGSPQGPLQLAGSGGAGSPMEGESMEDDEDSKSESYSWKSQTHKPRKDHV